MLTGARRECFPCASRILFEVTSIQRRAARILLALERTRRVVSHVPRPHWLPICIESEERGLSTWRNCSLRICSRRLAGLSTPRVIWRIHGMPWESLYQSKMSDSDRSRADAQRPGVLDPSLRIFIVPSPACHVQATCVARLRQVPRSVVWRRPQPYRNVDPNPMKTQSAKRSGLRALTLAHRLPNGEARTDETNEQQFDAKDFEDRIRDHVSRALRLSSGT